MHIYDSVKKSKLEFIPIKADKASLYVCGPTVYDDAHLGHARSAVVFDLLHRTLEHTGFEVRFARNITDIDDKIINKVLQTGQTLEELTTHYTKRFEEEMHQLNVLTPDIEPKATEYINAIEAMIERLISQGFAYKSEDGTVYFERSKDSHYFSLSHRHVDEASNQTRIDDLHGKKNSSDFALWKPKKDATDISFSSSLGEGRPGWHIECSAMIEAIFGHEKAFSIDIHGGGADLLFPHHENEASQSRCATGTELAKYWMHNGFVNINGEKMSKSLGNSFFLKDALNAYHGEVLRFYLLSTHYRANFNFNEEDLKQIKKRLDKMYRLKKRLYGMKAGELHTPFQTRLLEDLKDDLNTSKAFASIDEMVSQANEALDANPKDKTVKKELLADLAYIESLMGIGTLDAFEYFQFGVNSKEYMQIQALLEERTLAKKEKDFARSDAIRDTLIAQGISIMDTAEGTRWEKL